MALMSNKRSWIIAQGSGSFLVSSHSFRISSLKRYTGSILLSFSLVPGELSLIGTSKTWIFRLSTFSMKVKQKCGMESILRIERSLKG